MTTQEHSQRSGIGGIAFFLGYLLLEWVSHIEAFQGLDITPWNPASALIVLFFMRRGWQVAGVVYCSILCSELLLLGYDDGLGAKISVGALLTIDYLILARLMLRNSPDRGMFNDRESLLVWLTIVLIGSFINSVIVITAYLLTDALGVNAWGFAVLRFGIADTVGIFIGLPLLWQLQDAERRQAFFSSVFKAETAAYLILAVVMLWLAFDSEKASTFRYLFTLSLPLIWAASRQGIHGAVVCSTALQLGMVIADQIAGNQQVTLFDIQMRTFVFALAGFFIGAAVDAQRRTAVKLGQSLRLAAAGEMAAALAHELNQPLSALSTYGAACERLLSQGGDTDQLRSALRMMTGEANRAAQIVRRLRDFFRTGSTRLECFSLLSLFDTVTATLGSKAAAAGVSLDVAPPPEVAIEADRFQLEVVLRNLIANAVEAVEGQADGNRKIWVSSSLDANGKLCICVKDTGPGISSSIAANLFEPFTTTKASGLGLGLAMSRAIAEAHGGTLLAEAGPHGCFKLYLPLASGQEPTHA